MLPLLATLAIVCIPAIVALAPSWLFGFIRCGCNCEQDPSCTISTDDYEDEEINGWTDVGEDFEETGGTLHTTASDAIIDCDTAHPDGVPSHYVKVKFLGDDDGDQPRVYAGDHYAEVTAGDPNGCLALYDGSDSLLTKIRIEAASDEWHEMKVWYGQAPAADGGDSQLVAQVNDGPILRKNVTRAGNSVALGTGTVTGEVHFDDFEYQKHWTEADTACPKPPAPNCTIFTDNCTRADSTNLGCSYDELSGNGSISSNKIRLTSSNTKISIETVHPQEAGAIQITATVRASATTNQPRLYTSTGDDNYAQLTIGTSATLKLFIGGSEADSVTFTSAANTDYSMTVTHARGAMSVIVDGVCLAVQEPVPAGPVKAGIGCGTLSGSIDISGIAVYRGRDANNPDCASPCAQDCDLCDDERVIESFVLRFGNFADGACGDCEEWNDLDIEVPIIYGETCLWEIRLDESYPCGSQVLAPGNIQAVTVNAYLSGGTHWIDASITDSSGAGSDWLVDTGEAFVDCETDLTNLSLALQLGVGVACDTSAGTCEIAAVNLV